MANTFIEGAKVMSKGQVTIPKEVREVLGVGNGDHVSFIVNGDQVTLINSAVYAMKILQEKMRGAAEEAGLKSEEDVLKLMKDIRDEE